MSTLDPGPGLARRIGQGAALVTAVTLAARIVGFGRWFVFSKTVGDTCLGAAYNTANQLPNVLFEIAAGGALAGVVIPMLARSVGQDDRRATAQSTSALLTWAMAVLLPVTVLAALAAPAYTRLMLDTGRGCRSDTADVATTLLLSFVPQIPFYALTVVLTAVLQAHRRFFAAAVAPLVSSLVVAAAYVGFAVLAGDTDKQQPALLPGGAVAVLGWGTTAGVVAMVLTVLLPVRRLGLGLRPSLRFPPGVARPAARLAVAGVVVLLAQQMTAVLLTFLLNNRGVQGSSLTQYTYALAIYALPFAVLAVPIATTTFPRIAESVAAGATERADALIAGSTRAVVLAGGAGLALLAGTSFPVARIFVLGPGSGQARPLAWGLMGLSVGLIGYGLLFHLTRVLYACHAGRAAATAGALGWVTVALAAVVETAFVDADQVVLAVAIATSLGMSVAAIGLGIAVRRVRGGAALTGAIRALGAAVLGGAFGAVAGITVGIRFVDSPFWAALGGAVLAAAASVAVATLVLLAVDGRDLRAVLRRKVTA